MLKATSRRLLSARRRGLSLVYLSVLFTVLILFVSLAVDLGRAQLAKSQLRAAADAAAMYGAKGVSDGTYASKAIAVAGQNYVDGSTLTLLAGDVTTVTWNSSSGTITPGNPSPNAVQVVARRLNSRGTGIPLMFAGVLGRRTLDISVTSIARYSAATSVTAVANSKGNPWLAGMPAGSTGNSYDTAPANSPTLVNSSLTLAAGAALHFSFSGSASYKPTAVANGADGDLTRMIYNCWYDGFSVGRENGKSNLTAPIGAVVGVFLDDTQPDLDTDPLPADLDFSTAASRDFSSLSPQLRQPFYIGDGKRADGTTLQDFIVPAGATRFYIGIMDGQQWSDNSGSFSTTLAQPAVVSIVR
jgi:Flp pilus assembly protein TadG